MELSREIPSFVQVLSGTRRPLPGVPAPVPNYKLEGLGRPPSPSPFRQELVKVQTYRTRKYHSRTLALAQTGDLGTIERIRSPYKVTAVQRSILRPQRHFTTYPRNHSYFLSSSRPEVGFPDFCERSFCQKFSALRFYDFFVLWEFRRQY